MDDIVGITLYRHGLTEENKRHAYMGWTDSPLCPSEVKKLAGSVKPEGRLVFSSDLNRCLKTAELLFPAYKHRILPELREMHFGIWEGQTYSELKEDFQYRDWLDNPFNSKPPGGESFREFALRVQMGWEKIIQVVGESSEKQAAVVTHGGVIRYLLMENAPIKQDFWNWRIEHGTGYRLIWSKKAQRRGERCILLQEVPLMANPNG